MARCSFFGIALCLLGYGCGGNRGLPDGPDGSFYMFDGGPPDGGFRDGGGTPTPRAGTGSSRAGSSASGAGTMAVPPTAGTGSLPVAGAAASGSAGFGTAGSSGGVGGMNGRPPSFCDTNGYCLYPGGLLCYPDGPCCYPDMASGQCCTANGCRPVPPWLGPTPPAPMDVPWVPPIPADDVGDPGWRDSDDPLCSRSVNNFQPYMQSIWSDSRGVFVASAVETKFDPNDPMSCGGCMREAVHFNDGTGWSEVEGVSSAAGYTFSNGPMFITGFDNGPLILYGFSYDGMGRPCGLSTVSDGVRTCQPVDGVYDVQVVNNTLAYGLLQGRLVRYDGTNWGPLPIVNSVPAELQFMWGDETTVMATGGGPGTIYTLKNGMFSVEDTKTLENFSTIWGFSPTDVYAGTIQGGLYHYNGTEWTRLQWTAPNCMGDSITGMWGANGVLYFITMTTVQRVTGTTVEQVTELEGDCQQFQGPKAFTALWGTSENEVYVALYDSTQPQNECGTSFMLYYDGSKFHQM